MNQFKLPILCVAVTAASLMMVSCEEEVKGDLDGDLPKVNINSSIKPINQKVEAIVSAEQGVDDLATAAAAPIANVVTNVTAASDSIESMTIFSNLMSSAPEPSAVAQSRKINPFKRVMDEDNSMAEMITELLDLQNATADLSTNTITVGLNPSVICDDAEPDYEQCLTILDDVSLSIQVINSEAGLITVQYAGYSPLQLAYEPDRLAALVDLSELKSAGLALDIKTDNTDFEDVPDVFEGQFSVSINATENNATLTTSIPETVRIGDGSNNIELTTTNNLATLELDSSAQTIQFTSDINSVSGQIEVEEGDVVAITFGGASFDLLIDGLAQTMTLTNSGMVGNGLTVSMNNEPLLAAMIAPFSAAYAESDKSLSFLSLLDLSLSLNLMGDDSSQESISMSVEVEIPADTVLFSDVNNMDALTVQNGSVNIAITMDDVEVVAESFVAGDVVEIESEEEE
ncbi:MAG: hypothetical protein HRU38_17800 [Saccharospirillaceae bacterium]|nr:hypothetical protein [Pseudomonadales bacterium]NRB80493.1 hypothetical protein [Saccharospirillaceae bacterium]